jgi:hypothetical protein
MSILEQSSASKSQQKHTKKTTVLKSSSFKSFTATTELENIHITGTVSRPVLHRYC